MSHPVMENCSSLNATPGLNKYLRDLVNKRYTFGLANLNHMGHKVFNISSIPSEIVSFYSEGYKRTLINKRKSKINI